jgi:hypothetical protein
MPFEPSTERIKAMSPVERKHTMKAAWHDLHRELSAILYEEDPALVGSKMGSPPDEYDGEAVDLIARLSADGDVDRAVTSLFGSVDQRLRDRVQVAWKKYEGRAE